MYVDFMAIKDWADAHNADLESIKKEYGYMTDTEIIIGMLKQGLRFELDIIDMMEHEGARQDVKEALGRD